MRNIADYEKRYIQEDFEEYEVKIRRKKTLEIINNYMPDSILEIGCGLQPLFQYCDNFRKYCLIEPGERFYNNALTLSKKDARVSIKKAFFENNDEIIAYCKNNLGPKYSKKLIIVNSLLHELENPEEFLNGVYRVCDEKTLVTISVPNANSFHRILAEFMGIIAKRDEMTKRNEIFQQHCVFDLSTLSHLVTDCGFKIEEKGTFFIKPFTHEQMLKMMNNHIIDEKVLDGLYEMSRVLPENGAEIFMNLRKNRGVSADI